MFMDRNRKINGAANPAQTATSEAAEQRRSQKLSPNDYPTEGPEDWRFQPDIETCAAINENHYMAGLKDGGPYDKEYEAEVPYVGQPVPDSGEGRKLKKR